MDRTECVLTIKGQEWWLFMSISIF